MSLSRLSCPFPGHPTAWKATDAPERSRETLQKNFEIVSESAGIQMLQNAPSRHARGAAGHPRPQAVRTSGSTKPRLIAWDLTIGAASARIGPARGHIVRQAIHAGGVMHQRPHGFATMARTYGEHPRVNGERERDAHNDERNDYGKAWHRSLLCSRAAVTIWEAA
jgi:hypothetical protein